MSFRLEPRRKAAGNFELASGTWIWILGTAVGLEVCFGSSYRDGHFVYKEREDGKCLAYNDGAKVAAHEARGMASLADMVADYNDLLAKEWSKLSETDKLRWCVQPGFNPPRGQGDIDVLRSFADWARKSGGFAVH